MLGRMESPRNISVCTGLGIATVDSGSPSFSRSSEFSVKAQSWITCSSSQLKEVCPAKRRRAGGSDFIQEIQDPAWRVGGEGRNAFPPSHLWAACADKGCFVPRWTNPSEASGQGCRVTGMGVLSVSAASCPGKPDSPPSHLSGMDQGTAPR